MLKREAWKKLKEKLPKLAAAQRVKELKVLQVQTTNKKMLKEIKELLKKAEVEAAALPWREKNGVMTISSRLSLPQEEGVVRPREPELQDIVANVPVSSQPEEDPSIKYSSEDESARKGYFSQGYEGPGSTSSDMAKETRDATWGEKKTWHEKVSDATYMEKVRS